MQSSNWHTRVCLLKFFEDLVYISSHEKLLKIISSGWLNDFLFFPLHRKIPLKLISLLFPSPNKYFTVLNDKKKIGVLKLHFTNTVLNIIPYPGYIFYGLVFWGVFLHTD